MPCSPPESCTFKVGRTSNVTPSTPPAVIPAMATVESRPSGGMGVVTREEISGATLVCVVGGVNTMCKATCMGVYTAIAIFIRQSAYNAITYILGQRQKHCIPSKL